jgi:Protein of unknown function (DUF2997)
VEEQIIVTINPDGTSKIEALHFEGSACDAATVPYETALGAVVERTEKPEYFTTIRTQQSQLQRGTNHGT